MDNLNGNHVLDAVPFQIPRDETATGQIQSSTTVLNVREQRDDLKYSMDRQRRGRAVIFKHCNFDKSTGLAERPLPASKVDKENLKKTLSSLDFKVTVKKDFTTSEIKRSINYLASQNHKNADCLVVVVLTHGDVNGMLFAKDGSYKLDGLWKPFNARNCPSLAGKPKIFIIQSNRVEAANTKSSHATDQGGSSPELQQIFSIPTECDFLIAQNSFEEDVPIRSNTCGSVFISNLCEVLEKDGRKLHLLKMLTKTAGKVIYSEDVQAPCFVSNLTRDVYFTHKKKATTDEEDNTDDKGDEEECTKRCSVC